ncbi:hypothetical protein JOC48_002699 [Aquibacillus albus]|uniref:Uncharacterized protein n=1 Tax=Aquibacillus albus TaxID=1168171 RepID=A0ABS2N237_9BACI|nr:hypothetical protein [Aquibacillus albus]
MSFKEFLITSVCSKSRKEVSDQSLIEVTSMYRIVFIFCLLELKVTNKGLEVKDMTINVYELEKEVESRRIK